VILRIGGRGSQLSLAQLDIVARALRGRAEIEVVTFTTAGDRLSLAGAAMTGKDLFTREIDEALLEGRIDLAVHSSKDLPARLPAGLVVTAVPEREDPRDVLVSRDRRPFRDLPAGSRVGTSSARRRAQILAARRDLEVVEARGNVDTRLRRLREGRWDSIVLARAGLARLGRLEEATEVFPTDVMLPAIGQGALAVVSREVDSVARGLAGALDDETSHRQVIAERAILAVLDAGCRAPVAALASETGKALRLAAAVFAPDGSRVLREEAQGHPDDPEGLGLEVGRRLLGNGAGELIALSRG